MTEILRTHNTAITDDRPQFTEEYVTRLGQTREVDNITYSLSFASWDYHHWRIDLPIIPLCNPRDINLLIDVGVSD